MSTMDWTAIDRFEAQPGVGDLVSVHVPPRTPHTIHILPNDLHIYKKQKKILGANFIQLRNNIASQNNLDHNSAP